MGISEYDHRPGRTGSLARGERWTQLTVDAGLCRVGETLQGREARRRVRREPCKSGAGGRFNGTRRGGQSSSFGEIPRRRFIGCDPARAWYPYGTITSIHTAVAPRAGYSGGYGFSGVHLARGGNG